MRQTIASNRFRKDYKLCLKRGLPVKRLQAVVELLENDKDLPEVCRPHRLSGGYSDLWECHIAPDWLLVYDLIEDHTLKLERTGTHSDLFG